MFELELSRAEAVYRLLASQPRFDHSFVRDELPANGIYFFYEEGEAVTISDRMVERIVRVGTHRGAERFEFERGLIALLSRHPIAQPSEGWLGGYAPNRAVRQSGLWNTLGTSAEPLTLEQFDRLQIEKS